MTVPPIPLPTPPSTLPPSSFSSSVGTTNLSTTTTATGGLGGGVGTTPTPWSSTSTSIPTPLEPTDLQRIQLQMQSLNHALTNIRVTLATPTTPMEIQTALKTRETKILESLEQMTRLLNQGMHSSLTTSSSLSNPTTIHTGSTQSSSTAKSLKSKATTLESKSSLSDNLTSTPSSVPTPSLSLPPSSASTTNPSSTTTAPPATFISPPTSSSSIEPSHVSSSSSSSSSSSIVPLPPPPPPSTLPIVTKRQLQRLIHHVDPTHRVDPAVLDFLLQVSDEFIDSVTRMACQYAQHRQSRTLEVQDIYLAHPSMMPLPGMYGMEGSRMMLKRKSTVHAHQTRVAAVKKAMFDDPSKKEPRK